MKREAKTASLPTVMLGNLSVSRLIVGGNPFSGYSHQTEALNKEMRDYYTVAKIKETLRECERLAINTFVGRGDNHIMRLLNEYWNEGGRIQWIAQTAPERSDIKANIRQIASYGAKGCYTHGGMTDNIYRQGKLESLREPIALMKELGMIAGIGCHEPEVALSAEEMELGAEFYMICLYNLTRPDRESHVYVPGDREAAVKVIKALNKPVLAFKIMAGGRNDPAEAFSFAYKNIKPTDAAVVGVFTKHHPTQIEENVHLAQQLAT